jgi:hypothetical protein
MAAVLLQPAMVVMVALAVVELALMLQHHLAELEAKAVTVVVATQVMARQAVVVILQLVVMEAAELAAQVVQELQLIHLGVLQLAQVKT